MFADARDRKQICPHTVEKFDLRQRRGGRVLRLTPGAGGAGDVRPSPVVSVKATLRPGAKLGAHVDRQHAEEDGCNLSSMGDAIGRAMRAPTKYGRSVWRAESWPRPASLAAARQFTFSRPTVRCCKRHYAPTGWQLTFAYPFGQPPEGRFLASRRPHSSPLRAGTYPAPGQGRRAGSSRPTNH